MSKYEEDFAANYPYKPDLIKELAHFAKNPFNPTEPLTVDLLINFAIFDDHNQVNLGEGIIVRKE